MTQLKTIVNNRTVSYKLNLPNDSIRNVLKVSENSVREDKAGHFPIHTTLTALVTKEKSIGISWSFMMVNDSNLTLTGKTEPLVIVDGKEDSLFLKSYDPSTIESIVVLKDASAATIYGES